MKCPHIWHSRLGRTLVFVEPSVLVATGTQDIMMCKTEVLTGDDFCVHTHM
jgi:hypothetical protein